MSFMSGGPFSHEQSALDFVIANFDTLAVYPDPDRKDAERLNIPFVKAGTEIMVDGVSRRLQLNVYRFNNADGTYRYVVDIKKLLGAGANATVHKWVDVVTGESLAAKVIKDGEMLDATLKEAKRFNNVYAKLYDGKYRDSGKVFFTSNPKKDPNDDIDRPDLLVFTMPMFPGKTLEQIAEYKKKSIQNEAPLSLLDEASVKKGLAAIDHSEHAAGDLDFSKVTNLYNMFGFGPRVTVEEEFEDRKEQVRQEIKKGRLDFPDGVHLIDIPEHIKIFREKYQTKEQLDAQVKKNLERFVIRDAEVLPDFTPKTDVALQPIEQLDFEENFEFMLVVFKNMLKAVTIAHESGFFINDLKLENFLFDKDGNVYLIDLGEAVDKNDTDPTIAKEFILRGTVPYATPENLLALMNNRLHYPEAEMARKLLALRAIYEEKGLAIPEELAAYDKEKLEKAAQAWNYTYNSESDAYALGCCGEMICGLLIPAMEKVYTPTAGFGMPGGIFTTANDPRAAKINQFLKITKGLKGQGTPRISIEQAIASLDAINIVPVVNVEQVQESKPDETIETRSRGRTVTFAPDDTEYVIPEEPEKDLKVVPTSTTKKRALSSTLRERLHIPGVIKPKKFIKDIDPNVVRDIKECFKELDKSSVTYKSFVAKGTTHNGSDGIPHDCYRMPNGVIIAQTTILGEGANGIVYQGVDIDSGALYAIKVPKNHEDDEANDENKDQNKKIEKEKNQQEHLKRINEKIKLGNKLMASVDIARNPQHAGMYHTMNIDGLEVAIMPNLSGEQLATLIKTHVDPLLAAQIDPDKQKMAPAVEKPARRPSWSSFVVDENEIDSGEVNAIVIKAEDKEPLHSIAYYREKRRNDPERLINGYIFRIKNELSKNNFLTIDKSDPNNEKLEMSEDSVKAYLPDSIIDRTTRSYEKHREEKVVIDDPEAFIKKFSQIVKDCIDVCKDNATLLQHGVTNRDVKPENMIRTKLGLTTLDYDEAQSFATASDVIFGKEHVAKGSPYYLSPYNKEVYYHLSTNINSINAALEAIGIYELLQQQGKLTDVLTAPGKIFSDENLNLLRILADPPDYVWNAQSEANAIGISAEELSQTCFKQLLLKKQGGGMPNKLISDTDDPCIAVFNKFLEITKKLINPDVANTYVAAQAAEDFQLLEHRIEALEDVRQQLSHPQPNTLAGRVASKVQPYLPIGATVKAATDMTRQSSAWDNVIQTLAVDLDPTKHKIEVKMDKSVAIKDKTTKKSVGSLALAEGNVYGTTADADAFEQMLKVYIASHKPGQKVEITIVGLEDDPQQALRFANIAKSLEVTFSFDEETRKAVERYSPNNQHLDNRNSDNSL